MATVLLRAVVNTVVNNVFHRAVVVDAGETFFTQSEYGAVLIADGIAEKVGTAAGIVSYDQIPEVEPKPSPEEPEPFPEDGESEPSPEVEPEISLEQWFKEAVGLQDAVINSVQIAGITTFDQLADKLVIDLSSLLAIKGIGPKTVKKMAKELAKLGGGDEETGEDHQES